MSVRGAGADGKAVPESGERRGGAGKRIHFEALVAVGEAEGGNGGFEAESVDVSPDGMRLRTAYLPEVGDKLVCRLDGPGTEVVVEGEVAWRSEEGAGGEFGIKFTDEAAAEPLRELCAELAGDATEPPVAVAAPEPAVPLGARVRLHIEGLGSPMKARVRGGAARELEVGSNLEFLKLGRALELEDVEKGERREAFVDQVKIDVDPGTNVPQLVVSLRYERVASAPAEDAPKTVARPDARARAGLRPEAPTPAPAHSAPTMRARSVSAPKVETAAVAASEETFESPAPEGVAANAMRMGKSALDKVGPVVAKTGAAARDAMTRAAAMIARKRAEHQTAKRAAQPRRTTAMPPSVLKADGKRIVREESIESESQPIVPSNKRAAVLGGALGLAAVLVVVGVTRFSSHPQKIDSRAIAAAELPASAADSAAPVANVPLFGATPLSTTESVPGATNEALPPPPMPEAAGGEGNMDASGPPVREWGQGTVSHPKILTIKMDGQIERLNGASGAMGFTISIPGRRSLVNNSDLAKKDKRLATVKVVNTSQGAEITLQFKGDVPAYLAKIKGDKLEIALGADSKKTIAKKKTSKKKK